ncbi:MAG TPA: RIO1 family regulatory kinase/ATPase [bacterium]|nr:RIO1 family regulatory kinase/ATPase [bacterium]
MQSNYLQETIEQIKKLGHQIEIVSEIKSGKEAEVYRALFDEQLVAIKIYRDPNERNFSKADQYLAGKNYHLLSQRKAVAKGNSFAKKLKQDNWIKREFFILEKLYQRGAQIPQPIFCSEGAIVMELLGDKETVAPRLCDIKLTKEEAPEVFEQIIKTMIILWQAGLVHADLSEYNVLFWQKKAYLIDFPQAVDIRHHPEYNELLERDLRNLYNFFSKIIEIDLDKIKEQFIKR